MGRWWQSWISGHGCCMAALTSLVAFAHRKKPLPLGLDGCIIRCTDAATGRSSRLEAAFVIAVSPMFMSHCLKTLNEANSADAADGDILVSAQHRTGAGNPLYIICAYHPRPR